MGRMSDEKKRTLLIDMIRCDLGALRLFCTLPPNTDQQKY